MRLFLGIDGGQSSTTALIGDQTGRVLGLGRGGPSNHVGGPEGRAKFCGAISGCVSAAAREAGVEWPGTRFEVVHAGFSGGPADKLALLEELVPADTTLASDDARIALAGAHAGAPGIVTIAGTGSISLGRNAAGRLARAGGWGYIFGDEGGGFDLARQALRAALRYEEGWGPPTLLRALLLEATGATSANDLLHRWYTTEYPRPLIAGYSKLVDRASLAGDPIAVHLLDQAAYELASFASAVGSQLFQAYETVRIAYLGGVFRSRALLERFREVLALVPGNQVCAPRYGPAAGALLEAYAAAGLHPQLSGYRDEKTDS